MTDSLLSKDRVERGRSLLARLHDGMSKVILGQPELCELTTIAIASRGHVLLEGLPGLGKTQLVKSLAELLGLHFRRIQFTPDLMPSDVTGGPILQERDGQREFVFQEGPLFAHCVLADEINRASPKTQAALLEAMQERRVTVFGETHPLPDPFFVLATQNPIELEGTYPLPEAQLDRFLFKVDVPSVGPEVLTSILTERRRGTPPNLESAFDGNDLADLFALVDEVFLPRPVVDFIARLVTATHTARPECPESLKPYLRHGASPRAAIALGEASRARALMHGRPNVDFDDVSAIAGAALGHRIVLDHGARLDGVGALDLVGKLLEAVPAVDRDLPEGVR